MTAIVPLHAVIEQARAFAAASRSPRTRTEYGSQWSAFALWCSARSMASLPAAPATLALYLTDRASSLRPASLNVAIAAIAAAHQASGLSSPHKDPQVAEIWQGIRRTCGVAPRRVAPALAPELRAMADAQPDSVIGLRNRALLLLGFAGAFRRSELVALDVADLEFGPRGLTITVRRSKMDQVAMGARVGVPFGSAACPIAALRAWLSAAAITEGPVFRAVSRHGRVGRRLNAAVVARVVKNAARAVGLDPRLYSGHSLRAGLATTAAKAHKSDRAIMAQGRWTSRSTVDRYVRDANVLDTDNAAAGIGL